LSIRQDILQSSATEHLVAIDAFVEAAIKAELGKKLSCRSLNKRVVIRDGVVLLDEQPLIEARWSRLELHEDGNHGIALTLVLAKIGDKS
jgi:hypothetical protein